jgi:hypothetical protein
VTRTTTSTVRRRRAEDAARYAAAFDREDREDRGRRAPLFGLLPLRIARALRARPGR